MHSRLKLSLLKDMLTAIVRNIRYIIMFMIYRNNVYIYIAKEKLSSIVACVLANP